MKKRKKRQEPDSPFLQPGFKRGTIPWSLEEMQQHFDAIQKLARTPKDDWPLKEDAGRIVLVDIGQEIHLNQFTMLYQQTRELLDRYPSPTNMYHYGRIMRIEKFFQEEGQRLIDEGWMFQEGGSFQVNRRLLRVLATAAYSKHAVEPDGMDWYVFDYEVVIAAALALPEE